MSHSVELHFDPRSSKKLRDLRQSLYDSLQLSDDGEPKTKPHISLAVFEKPLKGELQAGARDNLAAFAHATKPFSLMLSSVGIFPGKEHDVVYLGPVTTAELLELHTSFHHLFKDAAPNCSEYYLPGNWIPHCTLAMSVPNHKTPLAVSFLQGQKLPLRVRVKELALIEFPPVKTVCAFQLKKTGRGG
jgi:2'-5' RNA ligase